jgi:hypothetical protein
MTSDRAMFELKPIPLCHPAGVSTPGAPTGVVTFLFTDIEGSTRRWEADAAAMRAALAEHDDVLRAAIEAHGGWTFKHTGDGMVAAFASPRSAVDAAVAAQRALELPVRMGIATGEAELRGEDYFGPVLNRAASPLTAMGLSWFTAAMAYLHEVLGSEAYDPLAQKGKSMTTAEMARYAYEQIDQARTELEHK